MKRALESCAAPTQQPDRDRDRVDTLTQKDICARLGISDETWRNWRKAGTTPPPIDMPGVPRWRRRDIEDFLGRLRESGGARRLRRVG